MRSCKSSIGKEMHAYGITFGIQRLSMILL